MRPRVATPGTLRLVVDRLLTPVDMSERLGHSAWWWRNEARARRVPHVRMGRVVGWTEEQVAQIVAAHEVAPQAEAAASGAPGGDPLASQSPRSRAMNGSRRR